MRLYDIFIESPDENDGRFPVAWRGLQLGGWSRDEGLAGTAPEEYFYYSEEQDLLCVVERLGGGVARTTAYPRSAYLITTTVRDVEEPPG